MAGRFPLFADAHVQQQVLRGLLERGWDVVRAVDIFPEKTADDVLFEYAAKQGRVFVTNDELIQKIAVSWLSEERSFPGLVFWRQERYRQMTTGDILSAFEALAVQDKPFAYPIYCLKPTERTDSRARFKRSRRGNRQKKPKR